MLPTGGICHEPAILFTRKWVRVKWNAFQGSWLRQIASHLMSMRRHYQWIVVSASNGGCVVLPCSLEAAAFIWSLTEGVASRSWSSEPSAIWKAVTAIRHTSGVWVKYSRPVGVATDELKSMASFQSITYVWKTTESEGLPLTPVKDFRPTYLPLSVCCLIRQHSAPLMKKYGNNFATIQ